MQKKKSFFPVFLTFFVIAVFLFILSTMGLLNSVTGFLEKGTIPQQHAVFGITRSQNDDASEVSRLREENRRLTAELVRRAEQEGEMRALQDQFQSTKIASHKLLPAQIIGVEADRFIIDKGQDDGVRERAIVIVRDNLVGRVSRVSAHLSVVDLITSKKISLTAKKIDSGAIGVIKGAGNGIILDNVVLSEKLEKGNLILTRGNIDENGLGFPPDLVVGRIAVVNKRPSSLFQTAEVESLLDFSRLSTVFIIVQ